MEETETRGAETVCLSHSVECVWTCLYLACCVCVCVLCVVVQPAVQEKPSLTTRLKDMVLHYYHGFRLLALDVRVAVRLFMKITQGYTLTRRENKQFRRTVADMFRIVPFSVFIIIPFMEFLLPVYIYLFPSAMPSTFQSSSSKVSVALLSLLLATGVCSVAAMLPSPCRQTARRKS